MISNNLTEHREKIIEIVVVELMLICNSYSWVSLVGICAL